MAVHVYSKCLVMESVFRSGSAILPSPPPKKNIIHPLKRSGVLNVPWTNVKVKNRPRKTGLGFQWVAPGLVFVGDAKLRAYRFKVGGPWSPIIINGVKWGPP